MLSCRCYQLAGSLAHHWLIYLPQLPNIITRFQQSCVFVHSAFIMVTLTWSATGSTCYCRQGIELTLLVEEAARCRSSRRPKVSPINKRFTIRWIPSQLFTSIVLPHLLDVIEGIGALKSLVLLLYWRHSEITGPGDWEVQMRKLGTVMVDQEDSRKTIYLLESLCWG